MTIVFVLSMTVVVMNLMVSQFMSAFKGIFALVPFDLKAFNKKLSASELRK